MRVPHRLQFHRLWLGLSLLLPMLPSLAQTGTTQLGLGANAYYDNQYFDQTGDGTVPLAHALFAETITVGPAGAYDSQQQAWARGSVSPTVLSLYSRAYAYSNTAGTPYSAFATAYARAYAQTPFTVQGGAPNGTRGMLQATLFVSGSVTVGDGPGSAFYDPVSFSERRGEAHMYFWATGLDATGCSYYVTAGCLQIRRDYSGDAVDSNDAIRPWTLNIPFTFGDPSSFYLQLWTYANTLVTAGLNGGFQQYFAESAFEHTLRWGGIQAVLDAQGQPVSGWTITSLPGLDLSVPAIPEPKSWGLFAAGLMVLGALKLRRPAGDASGPG
jgi:hypothetical protein